MINLREKPISRRVKVFYQFFYLFKSLNKQPEQIRKNENIFFAETINTGIIGNTIIYPLVLVSLQEVGSRKQTVKLLKVHQEQNNIVYA